MPTIKMLRTERGADDGFTVVTYLEGQEYPVSEDLARAFVDDMGCAKRVGLAGVADAVSDALQTASEAAADAAAAATGKKRKKADDAEQA